MVYRRYKRFARRPRRRRNYKRRYKRSAVSKYRGYRKSMNKIHRAAKSYAISKFNPSGGKNHYQTFTRTAPDDFFQNHVRPEVTASSADQITTGVFGTGLEPSSGLTGQFTTIAENFQAGLLLRNFVATPAEPYVCKMFNEEFKCACRRWRQVKILSASYTLQPYRTQMNDSEPPVGPTYTHIAWTYPGEKGPWVTQLLAMLNWGQWDTTDPAVAKSAQDLQNPTHGLATLNGFENMDQFLISDKGTMKQISSNQLKSYHFTSKPPERNSSWNNQRVELFDSAGTVYSKQNVNTWLNTEDILQIANGTLTANQIAAGQPQSLFAIGTLPVLNIQASGLPLRRGYNGVNVPNLQPYPLFRLIISIKCVFRQEACVD